MIIVAGLHEGLMEVKVLALHKAISLRVIGGYLDMMNAIFFRKVSSGCHEFRTIVHYDFNDTTPLTKDLQDKIPKSLLIFLLERSPLWPR